MPDKVSDVVTAVERSEGCEVHAHEEGRIVVTVEDTETKRASEIIMDMHQIPGVITVALTYHHFESIGADASSSQTL
ncbi:chaperone NapD [Shimia sp.]